MKLVFIKRIAGLATAIVFIASLAPAQSLGELAAKEKERRKGMKPSKVYTDEDLKKVNGASGTSEASSSDGTTSTDTVAAAPATPDYVSGDERQAAQSVWRDAMHAAKEQLVTLTARDRELQDLVTAQTQFGTPDTDVVAQVQENAAKLTAAKDALDRLEREGRFRGYRE
jgi:hypothetical protein